MGEEVVPDLLTVAEVAAALRCGLSTVYDMLQQGRLLSVRLGRRKGIRVLRSSLDALLRPVAPTPPPPPPPEAAPRRRGPRPKAGRYEELVLLRY